MAFESFKVKNGVDIDAFKGYGLVKLVFRFEEAGKDYQRIENSQTIRKFAKVLLREANKADLGFKIKIKPNCPCCNTNSWYGYGDGWHCEFCWNMWHHGERDKDFLSHIEFLEQSKGAMKEGGK